MIKKAEEIDRQIDELQQTIKELVDVHRIYGHQQILIKDIEKRITKLKKKRMSIKK